MKETDISPLANEFIDIYVRIREMAAKREFNIELFKKGIDCLTNAVKDGRTFVLHESMASNMYDAFFDFLFTVRKLRVDNFPPTAQKEE